MTISRRRFIGGTMSAAAAALLAPLEVRAGTRASILRSGAGTGPESFSPEHFARTSANYLERLVDAEGLPYFNVFWTNPVEAAHDWPDFGDVMSRQWQGAVMMRRMTGQEAATEKVWQRKTLAMIDPVDGQLHRPEMSYCTAVVEDASLTLYALATAALD